MLTPRRCAQLGLGAASLVLVSSVAVLMAGASDVPAVVNTVGVARPTVLIESPVAAPSVATSDRPTLAQR